MKRRPDLQLKERLDGDHGLEGLEAPRLEMQLYSHRQKPSLVGINI